MAAVSMARFGSRNALKCSRRFADRTSIIPSIHNCSLRCKSTVSSTEKTSPVCPQTLDLTKILTKSVWSKQELVSVAKGHNEPGDWVEKAAYYSVQALRTGFDVFSLYILKHRIGTMSERDWLRRIIFLETVAGVPGMVAGMVRHLHSLRLMRRDYGWIHSLLAEAENERMHLLIALQIRKPGAIFRACVIAGQAIFLPFYTMAYLVCPRYCHRFVGYLEEEAVKTYSQLLSDIDDGKLPMFHAMRAPRFARVYYNLPGDAMLRDVFECIRADEAAHRDTNHHFSRLAPDQPNTKVEHLTKSHFQNQNVNSGLVHSRNEQYLKSLFESCDMDCDGLLSRNEILALRGHEPFHADIVSEMMKHVDKNLAMGQGATINLEEFSSIMLDCEAWSSREVKKKFQGPAEQ